MSYLLRKVVWFYIVTNALVACTIESEDGDMPKSLPPWHLWGTSVTFDAPALAVQTPQIARVSYGRPEAWAFFFSANVNSASGIVAGVSDVTVDFDLTIGVGRAQTTIPSFERYVMVLPATLNVLVWSNNVNGPVRNSLTPPVPAVQNVIDTFPAQDIQLTARVVSHLNALTDKANVTVSAYFAPRTHVRPEWFLAPTSDASKSEADVDPFPGGEHRGK